LFGLGPARLAEGGAEGFGIGHDGVARKVQRLTGALRRIDMAGAAGIFDHHRNDSEIGGVARGRLDADFHRNAHNGERADAFTRRISQPEAGTGFTDIGSGSKQKFRADGRAMAAARRR